MLRKIFYYLSDHIPGLGALFSRVKHYIRFERKPRKTIHGFLLSGTESMIDGSFEVDETNFIIEIAKHYNRFINIGANVGYYVALAQHLKIKEIIGFEPNPLNFRLLNRNARLSDHPNTRLYNLALGESESELRLYGDTTGASLIPGWSGSSQKRFTTVNVVALDNYFKNETFDGENLMLLDIEGFEYQALKGMKHLLKTKNVDLIVEICYKEHWEEENPHFKETFELLKELEYKCYSLHDKKRRFLKNYHEFQDHAEMNEHYHNYFFSKQF